MGKVIIVGSGFSGAIIARQIAEELGKKVTVLERRNNVSGNMFDHIDEHGIMVQSYGPHVLVTNEWWIIKYLSRFSDFYKYNVKELTFIDGNYVRLPYNFESIQQLLGYEKGGIVIRKLRDKYPDVDRIEILKLMEADDEDIKEFANLLFEKAFRTYCAKQWNLPPEKLDKSIMGRSAIALGYDERYMNKDYQFIPKNGFHQLFVSILDHENIEVRLNCEAMEKLSLDEDKGTISYDGEEVELLVYTGAIDELFGLKYGELPYRSLDIRYEWFDKDRVFPEVIISYPQADGYVRKTEYKFLMENTLGTSGTTIATEYPVEYHVGGKHDPYYPAITESSKGMYNRYLKETEKYPNLFICGRLAEFRYYNMDDCIVRAFSVFNDIRDYYQKRGLN